jgi:hypothetical protein
VSNRHYAWDDVEHTYNQQAFLIAEAWNKMFSIPYVGRRSYVWQQVATWQGRRKYLAGGVCGRYFFGGQVADKWKWGITWSSVCPNLNQNLNQIEYFGAWPMEAKFRIFSVRTLWLDALHVGITTYIHAPSHHTMYEGWPGRACAMLCHSMSWHGAILVLMHGNSI